MKITKVDGRIGMNITAVSRSRPEMRTPSRVSSIGSTPNISDVS
jgi:hypothetical protein